MDLMIRVFKPCLGKFKVLFIDNILIHSKDRNEHLTHLRMVFQTIREHQLHSEYKKDKFWLEEIVFLGHVVSKEGIKVDLKKVKAITECPKLTNVIEIKNFSGLAGYY